VGIVHRALALVASLLLAAACGGDGESPDALPTAGVSLEDFAERGGHAVGVRSYGLVDTSRPTRSHGDYTGASERELPTEVWYPADTPSLDDEVLDAPPDTDGAPYPLIIFAHGLASESRSLTSYVQHLVSHGYVVAAPSFPESRGDAGGGPRLSAVIEQPADVSFVIDTLLAFNADEGHPLAGIIDEERIGVTGQSLGGLTTMMMGYGERRDARVDAIAGISPLGCFLPADAAEGGGVPAMVLSGSIELIGSPSINRAAFDLASPPRYWVEIIGGDHVRFADIDVQDSQLGGDVVSRISGGQQNLAAEGLMIAEATGADVSTCTLDAPLPPDEVVPGERQRELLRIFSTAFFAAHLRGDEAARAYLQEGLAAEAGGVRFEFEP
jgi:predicted dienelactone hydrolase